MPDPNPQADHGPAAEPGRDADGDSGPRDRLTLLAATPDAEAVYDWIRTLVALACLLGLLVTLISVELLVRI